MTPDLSRPSAADCARFEAQLGAWLEHDLDSADQPFMTRHRAACAACGALARDIEALQVQAAALPVHQAPRELWEGIAARLETPVVTLTAPRNAAHGEAATTRPTARTISLRKFAIAAALLVAVTSGVTWQIARRSSVAAPNVVATRPSELGTDSAAERMQGASIETVDAAVPTAQLALSSTAPARARTAATPASTVSSDDETSAPAATYEREIVALRHIVDERFGELDPTTVSVLRRNLSIIDKAIADSRQALARDPRSALVASQLDRALQAKLELLRRVALL